MLDDDRERALDAYAMGEQLHEKGNDADAADELICAALLDPTCPDAENFAGWLLACRLAQGIEGREQGLILLERAADRFPTEIRPLSNLAEACVAADQPMRAVPRLEAALARTPSWHLVDNLLGWLLAVGTSIDPEQGVIRLRAAVRKDARYGDGWLNLGRALAKQGDLVGALDAARRSTAAGNVWDPGLAWGCTGELYERLGMPGRALSAYRRAWSLRSDESTMHRDTVGQAVGRVETALIEAGRYFPSEEDDEKLAALERDDPPPTGSASRVLRRAQRVLLEGGRVRILTPNERTTVEAMAACAAVRKLLPEYAGVSFAAPGCPDVEEAWWPLQRDLWIAELDALEPDPLLDKPVAEALATLRSLTAEGRNDDARAKVRSLIAGGDERAMLAAGVFAEREGSRAALDRRREEAEAWLSVAGEVLRAHASWSTSGCEGMERSDAVEKFLDRRQAALRAIDED